MTTATVVLLFLCHGAAGNALGAHRGVFPATRARHVSHTYREEGIPTTDRADGCLFGLALGDALAAPVEFIRSAEEITKRFPPSGPTVPQGDPALVTDDTQIALAVGEALLAAGRPFTAASLEGPLRVAFVAWNRSPENDRAPGMTCMRACEGLERGIPWTAATVSTGLGT